MKHALTLQKSLNYNQYIIPMKKIMVKKNMNTKIYKSNCFQQTFKKNSNPFFKKKNSRWNSSYYNFTRKTKNRRYIIYFS